MYHPNDHALLHHAQQVLHERRSLADGHAVAKQARRQAVQGARARFAAGLGRLARLLAAIAEDLDPATTRPLRG